MALKEREQGGYVITTPDECAQALRMAAELKEEISEELEDIEALRDSAARYMEENHIKQIPIPELGKHGTLVQRSSSGWNRAELLKLVKKHCKGDSWKRVWQALTTRQPDPDKIQVAIQSGLIDGEKISPAFEQKQHKGYVQLYDD